MKLPAKLKVSLLFVGDTVALYVALLVALFLRYGPDFIEQFVDLHAMPFTLIFPLWLVVFYAAGLYDLPKLRNNLDFLKTLLLSISVNASFTIALFYLIPAFGITPKTTLFLFLIVFALVESAWRRSFNIRASFRDGLVRVMLLDKSPRAKEISDELAQNPQIGYEVCLWLDAARLRSPRSLREHVAAQDINFIVVPSHMKRDAAAAKIFYELLTLGIEIHDLPTFYEMVFRKVPLADLDESWFVEHAIGQGKFYDELKRGLEVTCAAALGVVLLPLLIIIAFVIMLTSPGPIIYEQRRVGRKNREFTLYKFRSMRQNAEENGAQWKASGTSDPRLTRIGRLLVRAHLDELPQLWNIIRGDLSFVGPRPERPEFVAPLREHVRFYDIRHLVLPGVTGWAQINFRYGASSADAYEKLQYDIYYLKNRSLILDVAVILKTLKTFFVNPT